MKPLLIAAALLLLPAGAEAQVAAASMPNSFDAPARRTAAPAAPASPAAVTPANPRTEAVRREIIAAWRPCWSSLRRDSLSARHKPKVTNQVWSRPG